MLKFDCKYHIWVVLYFITESKKRKAKNWAEDDYYDSDEDTFLDRTGEIEKKRKARMKKAGVLKDEVETFASLVSDYLSSTLTCSEVGAYFSDCMAAYRTHSKMSNSYHIH